jgi:hypothetical protein
MTVPTRTSSGAASLLKASSGMAASGFKIAQAAERAETHEREIASGEVDEHRARFVAGLRESHRPRERDVVNEMLVAKKSRAPVLFGLGDQIGPGDAQAMERLVEEVSQTLGSRGA